MSEIPKKRQEYFDQLKKALETSDDEMLQFLTRGKDPLAIRNDLGTALGQHVRTNYDEPLNIFKNKDILKEIPVTRTSDLPSGIVGRFAPGENGIYTKEQGIILPKENPDLINRQTGTMLHEYGHPNDRLSGFDKSEPFSKTKSILKSGLEGAEEAIGSHHKAGFFEKEALVDLLKNKKLSTVLPLLKAAGIGAAGVAALGIGEKAMAGDLPGAGMDAVDLVTDYAPVVGEVKAAISPSPLGNSELPPEELEKQERFNKLKAKLNNFNPK